MMEFERKPPLVASPESSEPVLEENEPATAVEKAGITPEMLDELYDDRNEKDWWKK